MEDVSFYKAYRKMEDWEWYKDIYVFKLFHHLLLRANWKDGRFQGIEVPRGSLITSIENLSMQSGLSIQQVRTALKKLEKQGKLT